MKLGSNLSGKWCLSFNKLDYFSERHINDFNSYAYMCMYIHYVPAWSAALTSAPCSISDVAKRKSPRMHAVCSGVSPLSLRLCTRLGVTCTSLAGVGESSVVKSTYQYYNCGRHNYCPLDTYNTWKMCITHTHTSYEAETSPQQQYIQDIYEIHNIHTL